MGASIVSNDAGGLPVMALLDDSLRVVIGPELDQSAAMCEDGRIIGFADKKWHLFSRSGAPENDDAGCDSMITIRRN